MLLLIENNSTFMQILVALISTLSRINHNKAKHFKTFFKNLFYRITVHNGARRSLD